MVKRFLIFEISRKYSMLYLVLLFGILNFLYINSFSSMNEFYHDFDAMKFMQSELITEVNMGEALKAEDLQSFLKLRIERNETLNSIKERPALQNAIQYDQYLLEHDIQPFNIIDENAYHMPSELNGTTAMFHTIRFFFPIIIPLISTIFITSSIKDRDIAYNYMMTLPMNKNKSIFIKWLASIIIGLIGLLLLLTLSFITFTIRGGVGDFSYPVVLNTLLMDSKILPIIPLWQYIILVLIVSFVQITCYVSLATLFCKLVKNQWIQYLFITILSLVPMYYLMNVPLFMDYEMPLIPFIFANPYSVVTQGYDALTLVKYFLISLIVPLVLYQWCMSKKGKGIYFNEAN